MRRRWEAVRCNLAVCVWACGAVWGEGAEVRLLEGCRLRVEVVA